MAPKELSRLARDAGLKPLRLPPLRKRGRPKRSLDSYDRTAMRRYRLNLWAELMRERFGGDDIEVERYARASAPEPLPRATLGNTVRDVPKKLTAKETRQSDRRLQYLIDSGKLSQLFHL